MSDNKGDLARFLSEYITEKATLKILFNSGWRVEDAMEVLSSYNETDVSVLRASHHIRCDTAAALARYTDILLLLITHYISPSIPNPKLWIMSDIEKKESTLNIRAIHCSSPFPYPHRLWHNVNNHAKKSALTLF